MNSRIPRISAQHTDALRQVYLTGGATLGVYKKYVEAATAFNDTREAWQEHGMLHSSNSSLLCLEAVSGARSYFMHEDDPRFDERVIALRFDVIILEGKFFTRTENFLMTRRTQNGLILRR